MDIDADIAELESLPQDELIARYEKTFGERPHVMRRAWLWRRFAYRLQEERHGGLSPLAQERLDALMSEIDLGDGWSDRVYRGRFLKGDTRGKLTVGSALEREWRGKRIRVVVVKGGFEYEGHVFRSLSAVARRVTGVQWSGPAFFRLRERKRA